MKSIRAVTIGVVVVVIVSTLVDFVLHAIGVLPPTSQPLPDMSALLATAYRFVIGIAAAWLTARIAPDRPMAHAMFLGYVGFVLSLVGVVATWNMGLGPHWYPIALVVLAIPQCWIGGRLYARQSLPGSI